VVLIRFLELMEGRVSGLLLPDFLILQELSIVTLDELSDASLVLFLQLLANLLILHQLIPRDVHLPVDCFRFLGMADILFLFWWLLGLCHRGGLRFLDIDCPSSWSRCLIGSVFQLLLGDDIHQFQANHSKAIDWPDLIEELHRHAGEFSLRICVKVCRIRLLLVN